MNFALATLSTLALLAAGCGSAESFGIASTSDNSARGMRVWNFDSVAPGMLPEGFEVYSGSWHIETFAGARVGTQVLVQGGQHAGAAYNVVLTGAYFDDFSLSLSMKAISGEIDRGGGPVWRAIDGLNYYVARFNPLEDNFRVYKVVNGVRTQLASADVALAGTEWHNIGIRAQGDHMQCFLDDVLLLDIHDATFRQPGRIGLWTKADAHTAFDGVLVSGAPSQAIR